MLLWEGGSRVALSKQRRAFMRKQQLERLDMMRKQGKTASEIALALNISVNTIRSYIRRHPIAEYDHKCKNCGKAIYQAPGRKSKFFCSDKCRMTWWNSHRDAVNKKAYHTLACGYCGKEFESYADNTRKYCCRECYFKARAADGCTSYNSLSHGTCFGGRSA